MMEGKSMQFLTSQIYADTNVCNRLIEKNGHHVYIFVAILRGTKGNPLAVRRHARAGFIALHTCLSRHC